MKRILIIGGGFAGVYAARQLVRRLNSGDFEVELFSERNYFVFQPLLPEVAGGTINSQDAVAPLRALLPGVRVREATVFKVDFERREVGYVHGLRRRPLLRTYDHLVLATGQTARLEQFPGFEAHSLAMRDLSDAYRLRNQVIGCLELAEATEIETIRQEALTFVVVGGGFSGVETMGELVELVRRACKSYPSISPEKIRFVLIHRGSRLLPELPAQLGEYAYKHFERNGVEVKLGTSVEGASMNRVRTHVNHFIDCRTLVNTVGSGPTKFTESLTLQMLRNRIETDAMLRVVDKNNVWSLGDIAAVPMGNGEWTPPTAQFAIRQAKLLATNIHNLESNQPLERFRHSPIGTMASLGNYRAVASIGRFNFQGLCAWLLWRSFYIALLPGFSTRLRVALNWLFDYFLPRNLVHMSESRYGGCRTRRYETGDKLFLEGHFLDGLYTVIRGRLLFEGKGLDGTPFAQEVGPGEHCGEWLLEQGDITTARLSALETTEVLVMDSSDFRLLRSNLRGFDQILKASDPPE